MVLSGLQARYIAAHSVGDIDTWCNPHQVSMHHQLTQLQVDGDLGIHTERLRFLKTGCCCRVVPLLSSAESSSAIKFILNQETTKISKQPIRTRYLGHVTGY
eukprot:sb/3478415/